MHSFQQLIELNTLDRKQCFENIQIFLVGWAIILNGDISFFYLNTADDIYISIPVGLETESCGKKL